MSRIGTRRVTPKEGMLIFYSEFIFIFLACISRLIFRIYFTFNSIFSFETNVVQNTHFITFTCMATEDMNFLWHILHASASLVSFKQTQQVSETKISLVSMPSSCWFSLLLTIILCMFFETGSFSCVIWLVSFFSNIWTLSITFSSCSSVFMSFKISLGGKDVVSPNIGLQAKRSSYSVLLIPKL